MTILVKIGLSEYIITNQSLYPNAKEFRTLLLPHPFAVSNYTLLKSTMAIRPKAKHFDNSLHVSMIDGLEANMSEKEFERLSEVVVPEILVKYEGFSEIIKGPNFNGTPFDFFGYKDNFPYIIEFKGSLYSFNTPGETQKRRLKEILSKIKELHIALLQVKLCESQYRIFYDEEMEILFEGSNSPLEPILDWIKEKL